MSSLSSLALQCCWEASPAAGKGAQSARASWCCAGQGAEAAGISRRVLPGKPHSCSLSLPGSCPSLAPALAVPVGASVESSAAEGLGCWLRAGAAGSALLPLTSALSRAGRQPSSLLAPLTLGTAAGTFRVAASAAWHACLGTRLSGSGRVGNWGAASVDLGSSHVCVSELSLGWEPGTQCWSPHPCLPVPLAPQGLCCCHPAVPGAGSRCSVRLPAGKPWCGEVPGLPPGWRGSQSARLERLLPCQPGGARGSAVPRGAVCTHASGAAVPC